MSGVFISYRRDDTAGHTGRLYDHLKRAFGADGVFMDFDNIGRGDTFAETLTASCASPMSSSPWWAGAGSP